MLNQHCWCWWRCCMLTILFLQHKRLFTLLFDCIFLVLITTARSLFHSVSKTLLISVMIFFSLFFFKIAMYETNIITEIRNRSELVTFVNNKIQNNKIGQSCHYRCLQGKSQHCNAHFKIFVPIVHFSPETKPFCHRCLLG